MQPPVQHSGLLCQWLGMVRDGRLRSREAGKPTMRYTNLSVLLLPKPKQETLKPETALNDVSVYSMRV